MASPDKLRARQTHGRQEHCLLYSFSYFPISAGEDCGHVRAGRGSSACRRNTRPRATRLTLGSVRQSVGNVYGSTDLLIGNPREGRSPSELQPRPQRARRRRVPSADVRDTRRRQRTNRTPCRVPAAAPATNGRRSRGVPVTLHGRNPRIQRTRRTVDLPAATHRALDIWQREAADQLGVARVTGQEVLTALIDQLLADPKLAAQIVRAIQDRR